MIELLPLLVGMAGEFGPTLIRMLLGTKAGEVTQTVVDVARRVFGTTDPVAIQAQVNANPNLAAVYVEEIKAETERFHDAMLDVQSAREQTVELAKIGSKIAWGAPVVSIVVTLGFLLVTFLFFVHPPSSSPAVLAVLNTMVGQLSAAFIAVVGYWIGSSMGSSTKDETLRAALVKAQDNVAATKPATLKK